MGRGKHPHLYSVVEERKPVQFTGVWLFRKGPGYIACVFLTLILSSPVDFTS